MDGIEAVVAAVPGTETTPAEPTTPETPEPTTPETPETPETPGSEEAPTTEGGGEEEELPGEPEADDAIETDGRALDEKTRKMVAELKKTNPAAAKALADQFYRRLAYEKEFPTVQDARRAKATIDSLGGEEGVTALQNEVADYRGEIEQFANGDPELVQQLYKSNPESTVKMVEAALDTFMQNNNTEAIKRVLLPHMAAEFAQGPLAASLIKAAKFIEEGKGQEAYDALGAIGNWLAKMKTDAEALTSGKSKAPDPREKQLQQQQETFNKEKREFETRTLSNEITAVNNTALKTVLDPFFKDAGIKTPEGRREFTQNLMNKVWAAMKADKVYVRQANTIRDKGDNARTVQFITAKFKEVLPGVFRSYKNSLYPSLSRTAAKPSTPAPTNGKPDAKPAAPAGQLEGKALKVADAPAFDDVDWTKTDDMTWARGYAHLKTGKYVYFH